MEARRGRLAFALFLLTTAAVFIRPGEVVAPLEGAPIYQTIILACLAISAGAVLKRLQVARLKDSPVVALVLAFAVVMVVSSLIAVGLDSAIESGYAFVVVLAYFVLLVSLVDTPDRLRIYILSILALLAVMTSMPLLQHHHLINIRALAQIHEIYTDHAGDARAISRLTGSGVFADPNEMCQILAVGLVLGVYAIVSTQSKAARIVIGAVMAMFLYGAILTQSRGGFLALVAGIGSLLVERYGWRKTLLVAAPGIPVVLYLFGGRQTHLDVHSGTGQDRIQLWSDALMAFRGNPILGIGRGQFAGVDGLVVHNSFLQAFAEMGFVGGMLFLGAWWLAMSGLRRVRPERTSIVNPVLRQFRPFLVASLVSYLVAMMSITRTYVVPTFLMLGMAAVYLRLVATSPPVQPLRMDAAAVRRLAKVSIAFLIVMYVLVRVAVRWH